VPKTPRLRELRERAALSQSEFAERSGVSRATIADLEAGNRGAQPRTVRRLAQALDVAPEELYGGAEYPLAETPPDPQPSFNGLLEEERRSRYLRSWRAFVWKLVHRWEQDRPKTSREIAVVLDTMQALIDEGAFEYPAEEITTGIRGEASEWLELQFLFRGIQRLNQIADTVEEDQTAQQRRELLKALPGGLSA
jgi:transcriptional regulator with XRE-family HTH domain